MTTKDAFKEIQEYEESWPKEHRVIQSTQPIYAQMLFMKNRLFQLKRNRTLCTVHAHARKMARLVGSIATFSIFRISRKFLHHIQGR